MGSVVKMRDESFEFVEKLKNHVDALTTYELHLRDEIARKNALRRDKGNRQTNAMDFRFSEGDEVSYDGTKYRVKELYGPSERPVTALVEDGKGALRKVRYHLLKGLGAAVPVRMLPKTGVEKGKFVMWMEESEVRGGCVIEIRTGEITVHAYEGNSGTGVSWIPLWEDADGCYRAKTKPMGTEALEIRVSEKALKLI
jgi:hypothetical protein